METITLILGLLDILLIVLQYGCIWFVPMGINNRRRKQGKDPYWAYFAASMIIEIALIYAVLSLAKAVQQETFGLYAAPVIAAAAAGAFYILAARRADRRHEL